MEEVIGSIPIRSTKNPTSRFEQLHVDSNCKSVDSAAQNQTPKRAYVAVVAAPGQRYVAIGGYKVVGGVEVKPAGPRTVSGHPRMRCIRAHQPRLSGGRIGPEVSADIACRQIERTQAGDLKVRKILAYASALAKDLFGSCPHGGHSRVEAKVFVNAPGQIEKALAQRAPASKRLERIGCKL